MHSKGCSLLSSYDQQEMKHSFHTSLHTIHAVAALCELVMSMMVTIMLRRDTHRKAMTTAWTQVNKHLMTQILYRLH